MCNITIEPYNGNKTLHKMFHKTSLVMPHKCQWLTKYGIKKTLSIFRQARKNVQKLVKTAGRPNWLYFVTVLSDLNRY